MRLRTLLLAATGATVAVGLGLHAVAGSGDNQVDARVTSVAHFFGHAPGSVTWRSIDTTDGPRWAGQIDGVGVVQLDQATGDVDEVIFSGRLSAAGPVTITGAQAAAVARDFTQAHGISTQGMQQRSGALVDHGVFSEYRITYQRRAGVAWLPQSVTVGVDAHSGQVDYFARRTVPLRISTIPAVSQAQAAATAEQRFGAGGQWRALASPDLEVQTGAGGEQRLVWAVEYEHQHGTGPHIPQRALIWVDAQTGVPTLEAAS